MLPRSLDFRKPSALALSAFVCSDDAIGSSVNVTCANDDVDDRRLQRLARELVDAVVDLFLRLRRDST